MTIAALVQEWPCSAGGTNAAIPVDIATSKAVALARRVEGTERLDLFTARGRVLATDFHASLDLPPFDVSAMDGYALRRSELAGKGPWILPVGARLAAGQYQTEPLARSIAVRIFTGAAVPHGFDAVVMQERCLARRQPCRVAQPSHANMKMSVGAARMFAPERHCSRPELCFPLRT